MFIFDKFFNLLGEKGISQYKLHKVYGISKSQIHRIRKNMSVTTHTLEMLLDILGDGYTLDDIVERIPDNAGAKSSPATTDNSVRKLPKTDKRKAKSGTKATGNVKTNNKAK